MSFFSKSERHDWLEAQRTRVSYSRHLRTRSRSNATKHRPPVYFTRHPSKIDIFQKVTDAQVCRGRPGNAAAFTEAGPRARSIHYFPTMEEEQNEAVVELAQSLGSGPTDLQR